MERGSSTNRLAEVYRTGICHRVVVAVSRNVGLVMRFVDRRDRQLLGCG